MRLDAKEMGRLWDMLDAARTIVMFTRDTQFDGFLADRKTRNAVERNLEILGEAARRLSESTRTGLPRIPWRSIIGLRNILAHEYGDIRYEIIWSIIQSDLPVLIEVLEKIGVDDAPLSKS